MKCNVKVEYTDEDIKFTLDSDFRYKEDEIDDCHSNTEPPAIPSHRCLNNNAKSTFTHIQQGLLKLFDGNVNVQKTDVGNKYFQYVFEIFEGKEDAVGFGIADLLNEAIPRMQEYIDLQNYLNDELFNYLLNSEMTTEELIKWNSKLQSANSEEKKSINQELRDFRLQEGDKVSNEKPAEFQLQDYDEVLKNYLPAWIQNIVRTNLSMSKKAEIFEFIRRVEPVEFKKQLNEIKSQALAFGYLDAFRTHDFSHPIFKQAVCYLPILYHMILGDISLQNASLLLLYLDAIKSTGIQNIAVCRLGEDKSNMDILKKGLMGGVVEFSDSELVVIEEQLQHLPVKDKTFFVIPVNGFCMNEAEIHERAARQGDKLLNSEQLNELEIPTVLEFFYHCLKFRLMLIDDNDGALSQIILPPNLYHHLLQVKFGDKAIRPNPVLGLSKPEDFQDPSKRDVLIPIAFIETPKYADNFRADSFYHHDLIYHCFIESANPSRAAWVELAMEAKKEGHDDVWNFLLDRETPFYYLKDAQIDVAGDILTDQQAFWFSMGYVGARMNIDYRNFHKGSGDYFISMLVKYINTNQDSWESKYGIKVQSVEHIYKSATSSGKDNLRSIKEAAAKISGKYSLNNKFVAFSHKKNSEAKMSVSDGAKSKINSGNF